MKNTSRLKESNPNSGTSADGPAHYSLLCSVTSVCAGKRNDHTKLLFRFTKKILNPNKLACLRKRRTLHNVYSFPFKLYDIKTRTRVEVHGNKVTKTILMTQTMHHVCNKAFSCTLDSSVDSSSLHKHCESTRTHTHYIRQCDIWFLLDTHHFTSFIHEEIVINPYEQTST